MRVCQDRCLGCAAVKEPTSRYQNGYIYIYSRYEDFPNKVICIKFLNSNPIGFGVRALRLNLLQGTLQFGVYGVGVAF